MTALSVVPAPQDTWSTLLARADIAVEGGLLHIVHDTVTPEEARRADIILVDITGPHTQPIHDLAATLVHSAKSSDVRTTIVDGRVLMRDRELLTIDINAVVAEMAERMPALLDRSHGRRIQDYTT